MSLSSFFHPPLSLKIDCSGQAISYRRIVVKKENLSFSLKSNCTEIFGQRIGSVGSFLHTNWSFLGGSRIIIQPQLTTFRSYREGFAIYASWLTSPQIASSAFTLGTAAVLPFYSLMVLAPKAKVTRKFMDSSIPYVVLGVLYTYLLYLSWTPDTIRYMFASKYWLPELPGIAKMFSSEMTLASAWIHLLAIDLFAARQVFHDGLENEIETRHSVSLCLLFCPVGIVTHVVTKALTRKSRHTRHGV